MKFEAYLKNPPFWKSDTVQVSDFFGLRVRIFVLLSNGKWQKSGTLKIVKVGSKLHKQLNKAVEEKKIKRNSSF